MAPNLTCSRRPCHVIASASYELTIMSLGPIRKRCSMAQLEFCDGATSRCHRSRYRENFTFGSIAMLSLMSECLPTPLFQLDEIFYKPV